MMSGQLIRGSTAVYGILGDPVRHSLSPRMHNAAFAALGLDAVYVPFAVPPAHLAMAVAGWRALGVRGGNVTIPHKQAIVPLLDELDDFARLCGAVNTLVRDGDRLVGYNTDGPGLVRSLLEDLDFEPDGRCLFLLGAGGAARGAALALAQRRPACLVLANRTLARAEELRALLCRHDPQLDCRVCSLTPAALADWAPRVDLLLNTSALGLRGEDCDFLPWALFPPHLRVYDAVYAPQDTPLVARARASGLRACDGLGMLIGQGQLAFTLWTGRDPGNLLRQALA